MRHVPHAEGDDLYHGPEPPGPGWVPAGVGPHGGKRWRKQGKKGRGGTGEPKPKPAAGKAAAPAAPAPVSAPIAPHQVDAAAEAFERATLYSPERQGHVVQLHRELQQAGIDLDPTRFKALVTDLGKRGAIFTQVQNEVRDVPPEERALMPEKEAGWGETRTVGFYSIRDPAKLHAALSAIAGAAAHAEPFAEDAAGRQRGGILLRGVHCFTAGDWQGRRYTLSDLDDIVRNFNEFSRGPSPLLEVPFVIGHEEEQPLTGVPAVGWVRSLRRDGADLFADVEQLFPAIARLVERGAYTRVSPEIYDPDNLPEGVPATGCMMRRLSALGGELPHIKQLDPLPMPLRLSERLEVRTAARVTLARLRRVWDSAAGAWACFSEVRKMADDPTTQIATAAIQAKFPDLPPELIDSLTPDQLSLLAPAVGAAAPEAEPGATGIADDLPPGAAAGAATTPEEMIAELVGMGEDEAALRAMAPADLEALYREKTGQPPATPMSEPFEPDLLEEPTVSTPTPPPAARQPAKVTVTQQFSEAVRQEARRLVAQETADLRREVAQERAARRKEAQEAKHDRIRKFAERMVREGRYTSADMEFDKQGRPIGPEAIALCGMSAVKKFGETSMSELDALMASMEKKPARQFGEQVQDPVEQKGVVTPERRRKLLAHTATGQGILRREEAEARNHRVFVEQLGAVIGGRLNGK